MDATDHLHILGMGVQRNYCAHQVLKKSSPHHFYQISIDDLMFHKYLPVYPMSYFPSESIALCTAIVPKLWQ